MKAIKGFFANPANVRKSIGAFVSSALLLVASHQLPDVVGPVDCRLPAVARGLWCVEGF